MAQKRQKWELVGPPKRGRRAQKNIPPLKPPQKGGVPIKIKNRFSILQVFDNCSALTEINSTTDSSNEETMSAEPKHFRDNVQTTQLFQQKFSKLGHQCPKGDGNGPSSSPIITPLLPGDQKQQASKILIHLIFSKAHNNPIKNLIRPHYKRRSPTKKILCDFVSFLFLN